MITITERVLEHAGYLPKKKLNHFVKKGEILMYEKGAFTQLKDLRLFKQAYVDYGTVVCTDNSPHDKIPFDYTKWREDLFEGMSVRELSNLQVTASSKFLKLT